LAWRYLNPRRAVLSVISLVSVAGVAFGVMALIVVLAVMSGLERDVKGRLLGSTPHILLEYAPDATRLPAENWREVTAAALGVEGVETATPHVQDNVVIDFNGLQRPVTFRAIDGSDPAQVEGVRSMLYLAEFPESSADLGLDDRVVISSILADSFGLTVGSTVQLISTRNFREVLRVYRSTEEPAAAERFAGPLAEVRAGVASNWKIVGDGEEIDEPALQDAYLKLQDILNQPLREPEWVAISDAMAVMAEGQPNETRSVFRFPAGSRAAVVSALDELNGLDLEKIDALALKNLKNIVLPKDVEIAGVYQASQHVITPDIFMPLHLAQELTGIQDAVQGVALRVTDAYRADEQIKPVLATLPPGWIASTWMDQYQEWFALIARERMIMYFVLGVIIVLAAFSMMGVMLTVTLQKKREIGVMKALGATSAQIVRVFLYQGMFLGMLGAFGGLGLGHLVIYFRGSIQNFARAVGSDPFPPRFHGFDQIPAYMNPVEHFWIALGAFIICSLAALVPAAFAARNDAARSLRNI
jgi:lipoprotein-releasing system permease protein